MKEKRDFTINLLRLSYGKHHFEYEIDDAFFSLFEQEILEKGKIKLQLELDKGDALIGLKFNFEGVTTLTCDRSLEEFEYPIDFTKTVFLKFGESYAELNDELIQIPAGQADFNIAQLAFEFLTLEIPVKKIHPDYNEEEDFYFTTGEEEDNDENMSDSDDINDENDIDPRWKDLLKLRDNK